MFLFTHVRESAKVGSTEPLIGTDAAPYELYGDLKQTDVAARVGNS